MIVATSYDPAQGRDLAVVVAQIVPVLLLAGLGLPLRTRGSAPGGTQPRALADLVATGVLIGLAFLAELVALFGVYQGRLNHGDARMLMGALGLTALAAAVRVLMPVVHQYADAGKIPEARVWRWLSGVAVLVFAGALWWLS